MSFRSLTAVAALAVGVSLPAGAAAQGEQYYNYSLHDRAIGVRFAPGLILIH